MYDIDIVMSLLVCLRFNYIHDVPQIIKSLNDFLFHSRSLQLDDGGVCVAIKSVATPSRMLSSDEISIPQIQSPPKLFKNL